LSRVKGRDANLWPIDGVLNQYSMVHKNLTLFLQLGSIACNAERCISHGNSVCPSVTCWYPIQTNELAKTIEFSDTNSGWGDFPFHLKFGLEVTLPHVKSANFDQYLLITSQP